MQQLPSPLEKPLLLLALEEVERDNPEGCLLLRCLHDASGTSSDYECLYANPAAEAALGSAGARLSGRQLRRLLPERDAGGWLALLCSVEASGQPVSADLFDSRRGTEQGNWIHCTATKLREFILVRFRDSTPGRRTATALEETRGRMVEILEGTPDAFCNVDENWNFTYINENAELFSGKPREPMLGNNIWREWPELVGTLYEESLQRVMRERLRLRFEGELPPGWQRDISKMRKNWNNCEP
jgi:PAS domain-containing protein